VEQAVLLTPVAGKSAILRTAKRGRRSYRGRKKEEVPAGASNAFGSKKGKRADAVKSAAMEQLPRSSKERGKEIGGAEKEGEHHQKQSEGGRTDAFEQKEGEANNKKSCRAAKSRVTWESAGQEKRGGNACSNNQKGEGGKRSAKSSGKTLGDRSLQTG